MERTLDFSPGLLCDNSCSLVELVAKQLNLLGVFRFAHGTLPAKSKCFDTLASLVQDSAFYPAGRDVSALKRPSRRLLGISIAFL